MGISNSIGTVTGKFVKGAKNAPGKTGNLLKTVTKDIAEGFRSEVPAKKKDQ